MTEAIPTQHHDVAKVVVAISTEDLIVRLRNHVLSRGAPHLPNGAWALMLEAANQLAALAEAEARAFERAAQIVRGQPYNETCRHWPDVPGLAGGNRATESEIAKWCDALAAALAAAARDGRPR